MRERFPAEARALIADLRSGPGQRRIDAARRVVEGGRGGVVVAARIVGTTTQVVSMWKTRGWPRFIGRGRKGVSRSMSHVRRLTPPTPEEDAARMRHLFGEEADRMMSLLRGPPSQGRLDAIRRIVEGAGMGGKALVARLLGVALGQIIRWERRGWRCRQMGRPTASSAAARAGPA